jgi:hypothetical protein
VKPGTVLELSEERGRLIAVKSRARIPSPGCLSRSLLTLGDQDRAGHAATQRGDKKGFDQSPVLVVDVQEAE